MDISKSSLFWAYRQLYLTLSSRYPVGTNVFEEEWDVLVLLDTCRVDALREVAPEYGFLDTDSIKSIVSVGSTSSEWIASTFTSEYVDTIQDTVYVSANAYAQWVLEDREFPGGDTILNQSDWQTVHASDLYTLDQPWKYASDADYGHIRPDPITDRAIYHGRHTQPDRLVVHYSQPHEPYTAIADRENRSDLTEIEQNPFEHLRNGGDVDSVWELYLENLRLALDSLEILLSNMDGDKIVISADHGEAFGEYGFYRHPAAAPHPHIKKVPWVVTSGTDMGDYEPMVDPEGPEKAVSDHLEDLGYL